MSKKKKKKKREREISNQLQKSIYALPKVEQISLITRLTLSFTLTYEREEYKYNI